MSTTRFLLATAALATTLAWASATPEAASAQGLRAQIFITQQRIPGRLSERQLLSWARGHQTTRLQETTEANMDERTYPGDLIVAFNRAPDDLEFHVLFYDVEDGPRRFVEDMVVYVNDRTQRTYVQRLRLSRERFPPQRRMEMVVTVRRAEVGTKAFEVLGEERRRTGEVSFSDDESDPGAARRQAARQQQEEARRAREEAEAQVQAEEQAPPDPGGGPGALDGLAPSATDNPQAVPTRAQRTGGCGCEIGGAARTGWPLPALLAPALLLRLRRRR